jgi:triacylglycerol lipase
LKTLGNVLQSEFAVLKENYDAPKNPIILAHGLLGFDEMHLIGKSLPGIHYWRGIREALSQAGVEVITATVPPSGCIERRAERLGETIKEKAHGKSVNIIAHSMGYVF